MSTPQKSRMPRPRAASLVRAVSFLAAAALLVTGAVIYSGFDVTQAPVKDDSIWAINKDIAGGEPRYARINTELGEVETVKPADVPSDIVQNDSSVVLLAKNFASYGEVALAAPQDFNEQVDEMASTPAETSSIATTGRYIAYLSTSGRVSVSSVDGGVVSPAAVIDPLADAQVDPDAEPEDYVSDAVAISTDGVLYSFSSKLGTVLSWNLVTNERISDDEVTVDSAIDDPQLTVVGDAWVLFDGSSRVWTRAAAQGTAVEVGATDAQDALLQSPSIDADAALISGPAGVYSIDLGTGAAAETFAQGGLGAPARPTVDAQGVAYAAWVGEASVDAGVLWSSDGDPQPLETNGKQSSDLPDLVFRTHGDNLILNDNANGWVWTIEPRVALVTSSQDWKVGEQQSADSSSDSTLAEEVLEPKPPVAVADAFGVRAGELINLPVLLNDSDPNSDNVLTIDPSSLAGIDVEFGELSVTANQQMLTIRVSPDAPAETSFQYKPTDGISASGDVESATVTLTVMPDDVESSPVWCNGDESACAWPTIQVVPGGAASANVLGGWVDPEGDPVFVKSALKTNPDDPGSIAVSLDGTVYYQHPNADDVSVTSVPISVIVSDSRGQDAAARELLVEITDQPELTIAPFAVATHTDEKLTVDPAPYMSGAAGVFTVSNVTSVDPAAVVDAGPGGLTFTFESSKPNTYPVTFDVIDSIGSQYTGTARVTVLDDDATGLSTGPITVFVKPKLDTTVDVFSAVSNPGNKLLILTEASSVVYGDNALFEAVVGHGLLRVKGRLGPESSKTSNVLGVVNYTVTDGTDGPGSTVRGTVTVVLSPDVESQPPIARDDAIAVRAGAQIDIPVLANDVSADGNLLVLDSKPEALSSTATSGLAFVSGSKVRLLAPDEPGEFTISYGVYSAGAPTMSDTATVKVTVRPLGTNQDPTPRTLEGRVVTGQSVTVPFSDFGVDPDGDSVVLDRVLTQPENGTATVSARGSELVYTSFGKGFAGTDSFTYQVKDSFGGLGSATVRIGVIASDTENAPTTFTDYVEVQAGDASQVDVYPTANDIDPLGGGALSLVSVAPDTARAEGDEFDQLNALIVAPVDLASGKVTLRAGTTPGTKTFSYEVARADTGSSATGYIVMKVIPEVVPDSPRVSDSYVSIDDRAAFATEGIDVLTGKVSWLSGDAASLTLSLWKAPDGFTVSGSRIAGPLADTGQLVVFKVSGFSYLRPTEEVVSYGFLRVPGKNDIIVALKANAGANVVDEDGTLPLDMKKLVSVPQDLTLVVDNSNVHSVARDGGSCTSAAGSLSATYTAGAGGPWTDVCVIPVKFDGQDQYTTLQVIIEVTPHESVPSIASKVVPLIPDARGEATEVPLLPLVTWEGEPDNANIEFSVDAPDALDFEYEFGAGSEPSIFVKALPSSPQGSEGTVTVHFAGKYADVVDTGTITLQVGVTPLEYPKGAQVEQECAIDDGSCQTQVIFDSDDFGQSNYTEDYAPLTIESLGATTCKGITFQPKGQNIVAKWSGDLDGLTCDLAFSVSDAVPLTSSGDRDGNVHWVFNGRPRAPDSITQLAYGDGSIQLAVNPGNVAARAYPALQRFVILEDDKTQVATCTVAGKCEEIKGRVNLAKHNYYAYSENSEGRSTASVKVEAWSFAPPRLGTITAATFYDPTLTTPNRGAVRISISGSATDVTKYSITGSDQPVARQSGSTSVVLQYDVGTPAITITPITDVPPPPGASGPPVSDEAKTVRPKVAGLPSLQGTLKGAVNTDSDTATVTMSGVSVAANSSDKPSSIIYAAYLPTTPVPTCAVDQNGEGLRVDGADATSGNGGSTISGLETQETYSILACGSNGFGVATAAPINVLTVKDPGPPPATTFTIEKSPDSDGVYRLTISNAQINAINAKAPRKSTVEWTGFNKDTKRSTGPMGATPTISVRYCSTLADVCWASTTVTAAAGSFPYEIKVTKSTVADITCKGGETLTGFEATGAGLDGKATTTLTATYSDGTSTVSNGSATSVPDTAVSVELTMTLEWAGGLLDNDTWSITAPCTPKTP